jgi:phosphoribosylanthranilate isomerase
MTLWVKVCGLTSEAAVDAALEAGVDAIGFVFAPSKRQVSAQQAARLASRAGAVTRVAVMQHPSQALVDTVWNELRPDVLQTDVEDLPELRIPDGLRVMPVIRNGNATREPLPSRVLFEGPRSGAGATADWATAARLAAMTQLVLAGGLTAANVASAIATVRPFGVDVSSGVESAPGIKDPLKIHEFVRIVRAAGAKR